MKKNLVDSNGLLVPEKTRSPSPVRRSVTDRLNLGLPFSPNAADNHEYARTLMKQWESNQNKHGLNEPQIKLSMRSLGKDAAGAKEKRVTAKMKLINNFRHECD